MNKAMLCVMEKNNEALEELRKRLKTSLKRRVGKAREDLHYSQQDVLDELECYGLDRTQGSLSQIENGSRLPSVEMLYVLTRYLNTSADYFLGLTENALSAADNEEERAAASGQSVMDKILRGLPPEKQKQVLNYAEYLLIQEPIEKVERNRQIGSALAPLTEEERIAIEARKWLVSIERTHGITVRKEVEKVFRNKGIILNGAA